MASVKVFVEPERPGHSARDLSHFQSVGKTRAVMITFGSNKDLGLVLEAPKGLAVGDPVPVPLEVGADGTWFFGNLPALAGAAQSRPGR